jgi:site-specific recombinase XerD
MSGVGNNRTTIAENIAVFVRESGVRSEHTARVYRAALDHFLAFLATLGIAPDSPVADLTLDHARDFAVWLAQDYRDKDDRPLSERSCALYLIAFGRFYHYLVTTKKLPGVTTSDYEALREYLRKTANPQDEPLEKRLPGDEIVAALVEEAQRRPAPDDTVPESRRRRLDLAWRRNLAIVLALQTSGVRVGELVALRRGDLDYATHGAYVTGKGRKQRFVRFSTEAWAAIMDYLQERRDGETGAALAGLPLFCRHDKQAGDRRLPLSTRSVDSLIGDLAGLAGIAEKFHMTPHKLRHYFATHLLRETGNLALTQDALGHASPTTTRVYAETTRADLVAAHKRVFDKPPRPRQHALPGLGEEEEPADT